MACMNGQTATSDQQVMDRITALVFHCTSSYSDKYVFSVEKLSFRLHIAEINFSSQ